jgi:hypothetical protein
VTLRFSQRDGDACPSGRAELIVSWAAHLDLDQGRANVRQCRLRYGNRGIAATEQSTGFSGAHNLGSRLANLAKGITGMSLSLENLLDAALDTRRQRHLQHEAERADARQAINTAHAKMEGEQTRFHAMVRPLIEQAVERANRHLAKRSERCEFCEISGQYSGPLYLGGSGCNPIVYELRADGATVGETLLVELTHDGMVEAWLADMPATAPGAEMSRIEFGWRPVRLDSFNADTAERLLIRYVASITKRWRLGQPA